jgi:hypothetical protein
MRTGGGVIILLTVCTVSGARTYTTPSREGKTGYSIQGAINKKIVIQIEREICSCIESLSRISYIICFV